MSSQTNHQKTYLQKISSLPTGLPKNLKIFKPHQPQTTTSTPTSHKLQSFSSQSHFFPSQRPVTHLPSALSSHTKQQVDHSFNSINSKIQNEEEKQNMMKKQSIYLYIKKYLNAEQGNVTKMKFKHRYTMYRPQSTTQKQDLASTAKGYLPRVTTKHNGDKKSKTSRYDKTNSAIEQGQMNLGKKNKGNGENLNTSRQSNISSRRRVNQMLKRDKQINNLHRNCHHEQSGSSSDSKYKKNLSNQKSKSKSKKKHQKANSIISERLQTLQQAVQVNMEDLKAMEEERERLEKMKEQITQEIMGKINEKEEEERRRENEEERRRESEKEEEERRRESELSRVKQLSLTEQLSMLQNRQNELSAFMLKVEEQHSFKNLAQLKQIVDNSIPVQVKKQLVDRQVSCKIVDVSELTAKQQQKVQRQLEIQQLKGQLGKSLQENTKLEHANLEQNRLAAKQETSQKELKAKLEQLRKSLEEEVQGKMLLQKDKSLLQAQQIQQLNMQKQLQTHLLKQQNKYQPYSLNPTLTKLNAITSKAQHLETHLNQIHHHQAQLTHKSNSLSNTQINSHLQHVEQLKNQLNEQASIVREKIVQVNQHLKRQHDKYQEMMEVRKAEVQERKQTLSMSHLSLRQKVADMQSLKQQLHSLKNQLQLIVNQQQQTHQQYLDEIKMLKKQSKHKKVQKKQRKYNQQSAQSQIISQNDSLLKIANQCSWGLFPIKQTKQQETVTFEKHLIQGARTKARQQSDRKDNKLFIARVKSSGQNNQSQQIQREDQYLDSFQPQIDENHHQQKQPHFQQGTSYQQNIQPSNSHISQSQSSSISSHSQLLYDNLGHDPISDSSHSDASVQLHYFEHQFDHSEHEDDRSHIQVDWPTNHSSNKVSSRKASEVSEEEKPLRKNIAYRQL